MVTHQYLFRRPRALQYNRYTRAGHEIRLVRSQSVDEGEENRTPALLPVSRDPSPHHGDSCDDVGDTWTLHRSHLDLFIDLIFVGIVGNLSEHFKELIFSPPQDGGIPTGSSSIYALLEFLLLFLLFWRVWNILRNFTNTFFLDDILQRIFIMWILILTVVMGNTSPWGFADKKGTQTVLSLYLVIRASFMLMEGFYILFFNRFLWREYLAGFVLAVPASALWIAAMFQKGWPLYGLMIAAMLVEYSAAYVLNHPIIHRALAVDYRKGIDLEHYVERIGAFFVIILGEGVLLLIKGSPLGEGITGAAGIGASVLALYFFIHMLYFRGNHSPESVSSIRKATWKLGLWQFCHLLLFSALLLLEIAALFVVTHGSATAHEVDDDSSELAERQIGELAVRAAKKEEELSPKELSHFMQVALGIGSIAMACVLFSLTCLHLLNCSEFNTTGRVIDNVFVRMIPRVMLIIIIPCLPLTPHLKGSEWIGIVIGLVFVVILWELVTGLGEESNLFEPEGVETSKPISRRSSDAETTRRFNEGGSRSRRPSEMSMERGSRSRSRQPRPRTRDPSRGDPRQLSPWRPSRT